MRRWARLLRVLWRGVWILCFEELIVVEGEEEMVYSERSESVPRMGWYGGFGGDVGGDGEKEKKKEGEYDWIFDD